MTLALVATTATAQTEQSIRANNQTVKNFATELVLNGNNVVLKYENQASATYDMLKTSIELKYDAALAVRSVGQLESQRNEVYDLKGRKVGTIDELPVLRKGIYIVNGKKIVVK